MQSQEQDLLREMKDRQLESQTNDEIWLCEITLERPWAEEVWRRAGANECGRGGKLEIFKRVKQRVLTMLRRVESRTND
jgi:hypothetical protein